MIGNLINLQIDILTKGVLALKSQSIIIFYSILKKYRMNTDKLVYDYIVVGSGAAGGVVFDELKKKNKNVLLGRKGPYIKSENLKKEFFYSLKKFGNLLVINMLGGIYLYLSYKVILLADRLQLMVRLCKVSMKVFVIKLLTMLILKTINLNLIIC